MNALCQAQPQFSAIELKFVVRIEFSVHIVLAKREILLNGVLWGHEIICLLRAIEQLASALSEW